MKRYSRQQFLCALFPWGAVPAMAWTPDILQGATPWIAQDYPRSTTEICRASTSLRACDPDEVFSDQDWQDIDEALVTTPKLRACDTEEAVDVQMAVAITRAVSDSEFL